MQTFKVIKFFFDSNVEILQEQDAKRNAQIDHVTSNKRLARKWSQAKMEKIETLRNKKDSLSIQASQRKIEVD